MPRADGNTPRSVGSIDFDSLDSPNIDSPNNSNNRRMSMESINEEGQYSISQIANIEMPRDSIMGISIAVAPRNKKNLKKMVSFEPELFDESEDTPSAVTSNLAVGSEFGPSALNNITTSSTPKTILKNKKLNYRTSHGLPGAAGAVAIQCPHGHGDVHEDEDAVSLSLTPREAVIHAEELNKKEGHENHGYLSFSHGFAPRISPITHFPPKFDAWNTLCDKLPYLLSSRKLRSYCDNLEKLPVLDARQLPAIFALRAANVLGFIAHAYWNLGEVPETRKLPQGLEVPWVVVNQFHLGRKGVHFLGFFEQVTGNFRFEAGRVPPPPPGAEPCAWTTEELVRYGSVEYDPAMANVSNYVPSLWMSRLQVERNFFGVITEMHTAGAPSVRVVVEAQEAASENDLEKLKRIFQDLLNLLKTLTFDVFNKIQQQPKAPFFVDATVWSMIVAPVAVPITKTSLGPSGTASPVIHLLDAFFGRVKHEEFIGKELKGLFKSFPPNWKNFLVAVRNGPSIPAFVDNSGDRELQGLFGACLEQYAGENGFLGRHKLKMVGYIEVAMKLGRDATIGGVSGLLKDRAWDKIADGLKVGQDERFAIPVKAGGLNNVGKIIQVSKGNLGSDKKDSYQVRINIEGSGVRYVPGSHVGILYESRAEEVYNTLLAFADGDANEAMRLGEEYMVDLNSSWISALQQRQEYHDTTSPDSPKLPKILKLSTFLKWGELRPASRRMLELAYKASHSNEILSILNEDLQDALTFSDVVTILRRMNVNLLESNEDKVKKIAFDKIRSNLKRAKGVGRKTLTPKARDAIFAGTGLTIAQQQKVQIGSANIESMRDKVMRVVLQTPKLCEIIEPVKSRHYSVASSTLVHPHELHLYVDHLKYATLSAVTRTSPLLANKQKLVHQRGAASDYIVSKSLPRYYLAIEAIAQQAGIQHKGDYESLCQDLKFHLTDKRRMLLKHQAHLEDEEIDSIVERAKDYSGGETMFNNLIKAIEEEMKDKPDPRDMSVVLRAGASPRFRLPKSPVPCIMICGGTGIAPFRAFWQQLALSARPANGSKHLLIIGQRTRNNMMFEDEILLMVKSGIMDVEIMFSQDECKPNFSDNEIVYECAPGRRGYIDKVIQGKAMQERLAHMIRDNGGHMYVCGNGGLAGTAVEALDSCLCNIFGENEGKEELEKMVAENRMVLDIFTSLKQPRTRAGIVLSELCQCNDFVGVRKGEKNKEQRLLLVINATVYDMSNLFRLHPGGDAMLKLYCGMDATKAWDAVQHSKAPEVVAMLEMFDTNMTLRHVDANFNDSESDWYRNGWKGMTMTLVEIQNAMSLGFQKNWDTGIFSSAEENLGEHFTVWEGKAVWKPKRSLLKGDFFVNTHNRLWSMFLPSLLGDDFDELRSGMGSEGEDYIRKTSLLIDQLIGTLEHKICDAVCPLLKIELNKASAIENEIAVPSTLQSYMEQVRQADDWILESIKERLITGLQVFETQKSPLLPAFYGGFDGCIVGIINDLFDFMSKIASLTITQFGNEQVRNVANMPNLKRGGIALIGSLDLDTAVRHFIDGDETRTLGHLDDGHESESNVLKCPMHLGA